MRGKIVHHCKSGMANKLLDFTKATPINNGMCQKRCTLDSVELMGFATA
jgi:hypothetical protein